MNLNLIKSQYQLEVENLIREHIISNRQLHELNIKQYLMAEYGCTKAYAEYKANEIIKKII